MRIYFCILLSLLFSVRFQTNAQTLDGITPSSVPVGTTFLNTTITATNVFQNTLSPEGNIYEIYFQKGAYTIPVFNYYSAAPNFWGIWTYQDSVNVEVNIPASADTGLYDLHVSTHDIFQHSGANIQNYILPSSFNIYADGYVSGIAFYDTNGNGILDAGENGLGGQTLIIQPINRLVQCDMNGFYNFPLTNGNYTMNIFPSSTHAYQTTSGLNFPFTINNGNVSNFNVPLVDGLISISPSSGFQGQTVSVILNSGKLFRTGVNSWGNIFQLTLLGAATITVPQSAITVLDSSRVHFFVTIPISTPLGTYDVRAFIQEGGSYRNYFLTGGFTVTSPPSLISGQAYFDSNQNGQYDTGEPPIRNLGFYLDPDSAYAFSDQNGTYVFGANLGTHTISHTNNSSGIIQTSVPTYTFTNSGNLSGFDFGYISSLPDYSVKLLFNRALTRCFQNSTHQIEITNKSNVVTQGVVYLVHTNTTYVSSVPSVSSINGDTLFWTFTNLQPFGSNTFSVTLTNPAPGVYVGFTAYVAVEDGMGAVQYQEGTSSHNLVLCSYDPNDKAVNPAGVDETYHYTLISDTLEYFIRFQNTGNDTAFTVLIRDTLDTSLDLGTLELISTSHNCQVQVDHNRAVTFRFDNILLPDSIVDEPGSHGFVRYRIRPLTNLPDPTVVENTAYIYFDFNPAVETNTTWNTLVNMIPVSVGQSIRVDKNVYFYPNPMDEFGIFVFPNAQKDVMLVEITDSKGQLVLKEQTRMDHFELRRNKMAAGLYFFRLMNTGSGDAHSGKFIIR